MKVEEGTTAVPAARRHIIRRPRLTRMLDESGARIILLVAPAGYGKTTLAQQWLAEGSRSSAWYRCTPASADVAGFASGVSRALASLIPPAGERMRERLKATQSPDKDADELAEMLAEDLSEWKTDAWLILDDYHFTVESPSERFLEILLEKSPVHVLATSRRRPRWASARQRTYGEVLEVDRTHLSMTEAESRAVLGSRLDRRGLLERAQGWPAVIGMAALTRDEVLPDDLPTTLYEYFAEELYDAADPEIRWGLCQVAIAGFISRELGSAILGDRRDRILEQGVRLGITVRGANEAEMELHPLLRRFLRQKLREYDRPRVDRAVARVGRYLLEKEMWDEAFEVVQEFGSLTIFEELLETALPAVLASGRVSTVQRWLDFAAEQYLRSPHLDFAEAELSVREGLHTKAEALAVASASVRSGAWTATAFTRAGRAAHLDGRPVDAINHHRSALASSPSQDVQREALWGLVVALMEVEDIDGATESLAMLNSMVGASVDDALRVASGRYLISVRAGRTAGAAPLLSVLPLVERSQDPMARSSFLKSCAIALTTNGRYEDAASVTARLLAEAEDFRLRFVLPSAHLRLAAVAAGRRHFAEAFAALETAEELSTAVSDRWMSAAVPVIRTMILLSAGEPERAVAGAHAVQATSTSSRAEMLAVRALALACCGRHHAARETAVEARRTSTTLEAWSLGRMVDAVVACGSGDETVASKACVAAFEFATDRATVDHFVTTYRASSEILAPIAQLHDPRLVTILRNASDASHATRLGIDLPRVSDPLSSALSPREREVFDLMADGLTNKQISQALYISESTTKVHVRHIFEKLGARTRTEAVMRGRERLTGLA